MEGQRRADLYSSARAEGKSYKQIAAEFGVTRQAVCHACREMDNSKFRVWDSRRCVYPNLRKWLNDNRMTLVDFIIRMDLAVCNATYMRFNDYFRGRNYPPKRTIDGMIRVTGLTYELLWERDDA